MYASLINEVYLLTSLPNFVPISSDTLAATLMAAIRRGCVHAIILLSLKPYYHRE